MSSSPIDAKHDLAQPGLAPQTPGHAPVRRRPGAGLVVTLILAIAAGGFGVGRVGAMVLDQDPHDLPDVTAPAPFKAGRFAINMDGPQVAFVEATVLVDSGAGGPRTEAQLRNALLGLFSAAMALPIVRHADDPVGSLERSTMAMAAETAPWLAGLDLEAAN